jgi:hypothetical protein
MHQRRFGGLRWIVIAVEVKVRTLPNIDHRGRRDTALRSTAY